MNLVLDQSFGIPLVVGGFVLVIVPLLSILGVALTQIPRRD